jgi:hypothetical protein
VILVPGAEQDRGFRHPERHLKAVSLFIRLLQELEHHVDDMGACRIREPGVIELDGGSSFLVRTLLVFQLEGASRQGVR